MKFIYIPAENRYITEEGLNSLTGMYKGKGRPRSKDYRVNDLRGSQRAKYNKLLKGTKVKSKSNHKVAMAFVLFAFIIGYTVATYIKESVSFAQVPMRTPITVTGKSTQVITQVEEVKAVTVEDMFDKYNDWNPKLMVAICKSENGWITKKDWNFTASNDANSNGSWDYGICQINSIHGFTKEWLSNPENSVEAAHEVWLSAGYEAWVNYNNGKYEALL